MLAARLAYGKQKEREIAPRIAQYLNTTLTPTANPNCSYDFDTAEAERVELKSRRTKSSSYDTWLLPVCKTVDLPCALHIFYHFNDDDKLFYCKYDEERFKSYKVSMPYPSKQLHYWIPRTDFTEVSCV
jgi:hypothetical protein